MLFENNYNLATIIILQFVSVTACLFVVWAITRQHHAETTTLRAEIAAGGNRLEELRRHITAVETQFMQLNPRYTPYPQSSTNVNTAGGPANFGNAGRDINQNQARSGKE